jgi:hypothetical protein
MIVTRYRLTLTEMRECGVVVNEQVCLKREPCGGRVRTRSGSDGIEHASCTLIGSLPLAVLRLRCVRTFELTRRATTT